jgi:nonribosomal peptide synthetase DhbF
MHLEAQTDKDLRLLSEAQLGVWFAQMLDRNKSLYNIGEALEILGPIDPGLFETALRRVVAASDALHLQFIETQDGPRQFRASRLDWPLVIVDLRAEPDPDAAATAWMHRAMTRAVDLARDPLFDYALLRTSSDRSIWYSRYHHLCTDGFGAWLISRRVAALYSSLAEGRAPQPECPGSWFALLEEEQTYRNSPQYLRDREYWGKQFLKRPDRVTLASRPPSWPDGFIRCTVELPRADTDRLRALGARHRKSLSEVFTAAAAIYVHRMTGARNITLGSVVAARPNADMQRIVGMFSNIVPLQVDIDPAWDFGTLLRQMSQRGLEALPHQRYRAEDLRRDLGLRPSEPEIFGPIINVCSFDYNIQFAGHPVRVRNVGNWRVDDLEIVFYDRCDNSGICIDFCGNPDLYTGEGLAAHQQRFIRLLNATATADPEAPLYRLDLLAPEERHQVLQGFNDTAAAYPAQSLIHELFEVQVERTPDTTALVCEEQSLSYAQLNNRANQLAHYLIGLGVGPDDRVAICMERNLGMVVALLGVLKAGGAYVPLDPNYPAERLAYMLQDSAPVALLTQASLRESLPELHLPVVVLGQTGEVSIVAQQPEHNPDASARGLTPQNLAYVIYTSGSTGQPKGVMIEHANVVRLLSATHDWFQFTASDIWSLFHSFAFDFSVWEIWGALAYGGRLVVVPLPTSRSPEEFYRLVCDNGVTVLNQTPSAFRQFIAAQAQSHRQHRLRYVIFGGEALETGMLKPWYERNGECTQLVNMYGITETTVHVTYRQLTPVDSLRDGPSPIGRRIPDLRTYILDENRQPVPIGVVGELYVGGAGVARGYLNRAELTAERFVADPFSHTKNARMYRTGDLGRWLDDGNIEYLGRNDFQVKLRGFRIELGEIEARLMACKGVREAVVVAREDRPGDKRLVAYLVAQEDEEVTVADFREQLSGVLPEYMVPSAFVTMQALPLTPNGKLDREALPAPDRDAYATRGPEDHSTGDGHGRNYRVPQTPTEELLAAIWAETLGLERLGIDENFFNLGGNSLLAMQLFTRIRKAFGRKLPMASLFAAPTIRRMATALEREASQTPWASLQAIRSEGTRPPLFLVPGVGGNVICYHDLAQLLGDQQPVYGLQSRGLDGLQRPFTSAEDIARNFVRELRTVQPEGPYYLGGASVGGVIAFEMAQQLVAANQDVAMLTLLESWPPSALRARVLPLYLPPFLSVLAALAKGLGRLGRTLPRTRPSQWLEHLSRKWVSAKEIVRHKNVYESDTSALYTDVVTRSNYWATFKYFPRTFPGRLVLILAYDRPMTSRRDARLTWQRFATHDCHVHYSRGSDSGVMLTRPHVEQLARVLELELKLAGAEQSLHRESRRAADAGPPSTDELATRARESDPAPS